MDTKNDTAVPEFRAKQMLKIGKPERLQLVIEEIGFIQDEIYRLNQSIKGYQREVKELTEALRKEVRS